jgi:hypothetical protein
MKRRGVGLAVLIGGATLLLAAPASAGTLDVEQSQFNNVSHGIYGDPTNANESSIAQTFTAETTGDLDQVDLYLQKFMAPPSDLNVEIWDTVGGTPINTLATESVPATAVTASPNYSFVPVAIDPPVPVTEGTRYAIVAWTASPNTAYYSWGEANGNPYADGELRVQQGMNTSPPNPALWGPSGATVDMTFKTYVDVPATMTPTTPATSPPTATAASQTGQRGAALKKCKKKKGKARKKCKKRALKLPV